MLNYRKTYNSDYINFLCNKSFSKLIFCLKSEEREYVKYNSPNSSVFYIEDIGNKNLMKGILNKEYDIIIASKVFEKKSEQSQTHLNDAAFLNDGTRIHISRRVWPQLREASWRKYLPDTNARFDPWTVHCWLHF